MGKLLQTFIIVLVVAVLAIGITNLVFTIKVNNKTNKLSENVTTVINTPPRTQVPGLNISDTPGFKDAATQLLRGIDRNVDPCTDFYAFTCNNYLKTIQIPENKSRIGTYDEAQEKVYDEISQSLEKLDLSKASFTEKLTKHIYTKCLENFNATSTDKSKILYTQLKTDLGDVPMFNQAWTPKKLDDILTVIGKWENQWGLSTLFSAGVTADNGNSAKPALYMSPYPIQLQLPLDYFIKPQFLEELDDYRQDLEALFTEFAKLVGVDKTQILNIPDAVKELVQFEVQLAMNVVPNDLLKNARLQFNNYTLSQFADAFPSIGQNYFIALLNGILPPAQIQTTDFVVTQPRYYRALDGILQDKQFKVQTLVNFLTMNFLSNNAAFIGGNTRTIVNSIKEIRYKPREKDYDPVKQQCVDQVQALMPYGTGFVYINSMSETERNSIVADITKQVTNVISEFLKNVDSLKWMTKASKQAVHTKADNVIKNIAFPYWFNFKDKSKVDDYHTNYRGIEKVDDYFTILNRLSTAQQKTENLGLLAKDTVDRQNFQDSPATVNAWYAPELNSITVPRAILNEPYYRLDFPQAYNYAGNGGTIGHELTHGFDSDGVQYSGTGQLANCDYNFCTILDKNSTTGFLDMAQCVISQFNEQCCPLKKGNVHCANGVNTQGENIADIGGQYAAYNAYRRYIKEDRKGAEEDLLPGLQEYTGNQIFWITYGFSWCMKQEEDNLAHQLLTNEHAPGSCRVNQVLQDLPEFAQDFNCKPKSAMAPEQKCVVWRS